ncbi:hypothetical protein EDD37DRAFT_5469 [Exophiala viscosa]|uniref:uncharacterized protein n=1 Tax=Exophiala viscosa TaxID=2486360 RepID=UPI00219382E3|nr:hypothetical protein EDD37DRAFT_5469 [Exophiala viscosa]
MKTGLRPVTCIFLALGLSRFSGTLPKDQRDRSEDDSGVSRARLVRLFPGSVDWRKSNCRGYTPSNALAIGESELRSRRKMVAMIFLQLIIVLGLKNMKRLREVVKSDEKVRQLRHKTRWEKQGRGTSTVTQCCSIPRFSSPFALFGIPLTKTRWSHKSCCICYCVYPKYPYNATRFRASEGQTQRPYAFLISAIPTAASAERPAEATQTNRLCGTVNG